MKYEKIRVVTDTLDMTYYVSELGINDFKKQLERNKNSIFLTAVSDYVINNSLNCISKSRDILDYEKFIDSVIAEKQ